MAKKKLTELKQIHGKVEGIQPTTLDQVWGDRGLGRYKTNDVDTYRTQLSEMNKSDLQAHAASIGIVPIDDRELLTRKLVKEFQLFTASFRHPRNDKKPIVPSKKALEILREGR